MQNNPAHAGQSVDRIDTVPRLGLALGGRAAKRVEGRDPAQHDAAVLARGLLDRFDDLHVLEALLARRVRDLAGLDAPRQVIDLERELLRLFDLRLTAELVLAAHLVHLELEAGVVERGIHAEPAALVGEAAVPPRAVRAEARREAA